jgi:hyperosmotically inducible periplasmic protein
MRRHILAATAMLLIAAPWAHALEQPAAPSRAGSDVPGASMPASPETQALVQTGAADDAITRRVAKAILADPRLAGADVSVDTDHGIVSLTGNVRSREQAAAAIESAEAPDGVMRVDDHLSVMLR